jgi:hypothetical protein
MLEVSVWKDLLDPKGGWGRVGGEIEVGSPGGSMTTLTHRMIEHQSMSTGSRFVRFLLGNPWKLKRQEQASSSVKSPGTLDHNYMLLT